VRAFEFFGGVPEIVVPDNLKSGVTSACYYEPDVNPSYQEMAAFYGVAIIPARVKRPRDKAKVENHVLNAERRILAPLRNHRFVGLAECNQAISKLLIALNNRPFQQMSGSRRELFLALDSPALRPLPQAAYCFGSWKKARVSIDYHVAVERSFYSVPYTLVKQQIDVRVSERVVELFHKGQRIASHPRSLREGAYSTTPSHMPAAHRAYQEWTPQRLIRWAQQTGGATADVIEIIMATKSHPQQGFRSCLGVMNLSKTFGIQRLEDACTRAIAIGAPGYKCIRNILVNKLDQAPIAPSLAAKTPPIIHHNIRGAGYYQSALTFDHDETKGN
jgi:transposase